MSAFARELREAAGHVFRKTVADGKQPKRAGRRQRWRERDEQEENREAPGGREEFHRGSREGKNRGRAGGNDQVAFRSAAESSCGSLPSRSDATEARPAASPIGTEFPVTR